MEFSREILVDSRILAMDLFQLLMVAVAFFMSVTEYRRSRMQEYTYLSGGLLILIAFFATRVFVGGSFDLVGILQLPSVDLLGSFFEIIGILLITFFFSSNVMPDIRLPLRWGRILMLGIIVLTGLIILLQVFDLFEGFEMWVFFGRPAFRLAVLIAIGSAISQLSSGKIKPVMTITAFSALAIAHLYHLFYYSSSSQPPGFLDAIYPWPYIFNPAGYFLLTSAVFRKINEDQSYISEQLKRRTRDLETATSNLSRLNRLSTNLLRTNELKGIIRMILDSLNIDLGFKNTALFIIEKESATLRGFKISPLTGAPIGYPQISVLERSFAVRCFFEAKSQFYGDPYAGADGVFLRDFDFSTKIAIVPLLTKKEVECHEFRKCKNKNCPVQSLDVNVCWLMKEESCPCGDRRDRNSVLTCMSCPAFNLVGMLVLDNRNARLKADEQLISFLETFANQAGMALHNAFLVEDLSKESILRTETLKNLPVGVIVLDPKGEIREFNYAMCQISGLSEVGSIGRHYTEIRIVDNTPLLNEQIRVFLESLSTDQASDIISDTFSRGGTTKILNIRLRPIYKSDRLNGLIIMAEDITSMKELERQLIRSEALAGMGQLAMGIAHEINNPLAGVSGVLQVLESRFADGSSEKKAMLTAKKDLKRASGIIKDLLSFAKQKAPVMKLADINSLIGESIDFIPYQPGGENITILKDFDGNMPLIMVDSDQIQQVLTNLILNSLAVLSQKHGAEGIIEISTWFDKSFVYIHFEDNGSGISHENLKKIFDPFFTTKGSGKGTGLGLSLCDRIISDHKGIITVRSEQGLGTAFLIKLPRKAN
ncbi:PAS domain S-box protein [bacterium]|nr:PAS domain S-box protein [bacterium]MBU1025440.1 PAS domain S-box protein [bacterium]